MGGMEMMLVNMLKSLGVNPEQFMSVITGMEATAKTIIEQQGTIIQQNARILRHLHAQQIQEGYTLDGDGTDDNPGSGSGIDDPGRLNGHGGNAGPDAGTGP